MAKHLSASLRKAISHPVFPIAPDFLKSSLAPRNHLILSLPILLPSSVCQMKNNLIVDSSPSRYILDVTFTLVYYFHT